MFGQDRVKYSRHFKRQETGYVELVTNALCGQGKRMNGEHHNTLPRTPFKERLDPAAVSAIGKQLPTVTHLQGLPQLQTTSCPRPWSLGHHSGSLPDNCWPPSTLDLPRGLTKVSTAPITVCLSLCPILLPLNSFPQTVILPAKLQFSVGFQRTQPVT
jgi:hypothetical protein